MTNYVEENKELSTVNSGENSEEVVDTVETTATTEAVNDGENYILEVEGLKKYFAISKNLFGKPTKFLRAVDDISFKLKPNKTIGVVGESGCGKTTLGRTILKLYESDGGKIVFNGDDITNLKKEQMKKYRTDIQLVFQDPYSSLPPRMTVGNIISEAVRVHKIVPKEQVHDYVMDIMKKCGLQPQYFDRYPHEFSGGQRQRICIARALALKPDVLAGTGAAMSGASSLVMNEVKHGGKKLLKSPKAREIVKAAVKKHGTEVLRNSNKAGKALIATGAVVGSAGLIKRHKDKKKDDNNKN